MARLIDIIRSDKPLPVKMAHEIAKIRNNLGPDISCGLGTVDLIRQHVLTNEELSTQFVSLAKEERQTITKD